jgi:hypothetical protein
MDSLPEVKIALPYIKNLLEQFRNAVVNTILNKGYIDTLSKTWVFSQRESVSDDKILWNFEYNNIKEEQDFLRKQLENMAKEKNNKAKNKNSVKERSPKSDLIDEKTKREAEINILSLSNRFEALQKLCDDQRIHLEERTPEKIIWGVVNLKKIVNKTLKTSKKKDLLNHSLKDVFTLIINENDELIKRDPVKINIEVQAVSDGKELLKDKLELLIDKPDLFDWDKDDQRNFILTRTNVIEIVVYQMKKTNIPEYYRDKIYKFLRKIPIGEDTSKVINFIINMLCCCLKD